MEIHFILFEKKIVFNILTSFDKVMSVRKVFANALCLCASFLNKLFSKNVVLLRVCVN